MSNSRTRLKRVLRVGERITLDNGRIVIELERRQGQAAGLFFDLSADVVVNKPAAEEGERVRIADVQASRNSS
jgi:hypothetical protein